MTTRIVILFLLVLFMIPWNSQISAQAIEKPEFAFGVIADVQYGDVEPESNRYFRQSLGKLSEAVEEFNSRDLAFVIQLGDIIDRDFVSFEKVLPVYKQINAPSYHVLGNHDFKMKPAEQRNVTKALGLERGNYNFSYQSWRFIVLDGNDLSLYATPQESEKYVEAEGMFLQLQQQEAPHAQTWNGGISQEQRLWLKATLDQAIEQGEKVILFCHFPILPENKHNLWNDSELLALLNMYPNIVAYMSGHNHAGNYLEYEGIHYLTFQGMVDTKGTNAYAVVEVYSDYAKVLGKGREPQRKLAIK